MSKTDSKKLKAMGTAIIWTSLVHLKEALHAQRDGDLILVGAILEEEIKRTETNLKAFSDELCDIEKKTDFIEHTNQSIKEP